jgi:hypothetical protein
MIGGDILDLLAYIQFSAVRAQLSSAYKQMAAVASPPGKHSFPPSTDSRK